MSDGGSAFPSLEIGQAGMSLRDWFAGKAMQALLSDPKYLQAIKAQSLEVDSFVANTAYEMADAMLGQREKEAK